MPEPTSSWVCPPERSDIIENLVSGVGTSDFSVSLDGVVYPSRSDRYNPSNIGILEDYLYHQTRSEEYDSLANLAILKLYATPLGILIAMKLTLQILISRYQFNPALYNTDVVIHILIKALTSSPFPDFHLCVSLLDERPPSTNPDDPDLLPSILPQLQQLYALLQQCRFPAFWSLYLSDEYRVLREEYTVESVAFEDSVRKVVVRAVKAAFTRIGVKRLSGYFNLEGAFFLPDPTKHLIRTSCRSCIRGLCFKIGVVHRE